MSDIVNKELKERYDLYDKIISSCMVNFYSFSKDNNKNKKRIKPEYYPIGVSHNSLIGTKRS